ncbi:MAG: hypothetical protein LBC44_02480 [Mycoplasmataceae bacterium]|nr:hypothetical protein [Mycoplasmataceae bacterium]
MNFVALIGTIEKIQKNTTNNSTTVELRVECFRDKIEENWETVVKIDVDNKEFESELAQLKDGQIIGVKGAVNEHGLVKCERLQIFS